MSKALMFLASLLIPLDANMAHAQQLAPQSREHRLSGPKADDGAAWQPTLLLREQIPATGGRTHPVLYVHGATFSSALSVMFRFQGISWADRLNQAGFDVFGLDFAGYGGSERYLAMNDAIASAEGSLGRADTAANQIERAVRFVIAETGASRIPIIAHSWGTIATGLFASRHPELVERLVFFGPIVRRDEPRRTAKFGPWQPITVAAQHTRFVEDVPEEESPVLFEGEFLRWAEAYLDSDPTSRQRTPASVKTPTGPTFDILAAWSGELAYDPGLIRAPVAIIHGAWDSLSTGSDAEWLRSALTASPEIRTVTVPRATHLMHLESGREDLFVATTEFLETSR